eukprot:33457-Hanusia_phi.AAC.1
MTFGGMPETQASISTLNFRGTNRGCLRLLGLLRLALPWELNLLACIFVLPGPLAMSSSNGFSPSPGRKSSGPISQGPSPSAG